MSTKFRTECPTCESYVTFNEGQKTVVCRHCRQFFEPGEAEPVPTESSGQSSSSSKKKKTSEPEAPEILRPLIKPTAPPIPQEQVFKDGGFPYLSGELSSNEIVRSAARRQKRQSIKFWFFVAVCAVTLMVAAAVYIREGMPDKNAVSQNETKSVPTSPVSPLQKTNVENIPAVGNVNKVEFVPFKYHSIESAQKIWTKIYPSIFELTVERGDESTIAIGTLIDSRGWLATSYSAIKNATKVKCVGVPNQPVLDRIAEPNTDISRGLLAVDEAHDLAIIQINRKLVSVIAPLRIAPTIPVVGVYGFVVNSPQLSRKAWLYESRTEFESDSIDLSSELQGLLEEHGFTPDKHWQIHDAPIEIPSGSPIFTAAGEIVGIAILKNTRGQGIVASAKLLDGMMQHTLAQPEPFTSKSSATTSDKTSSQSESITKEIPVEAEVDSDAPVLPSDDENFSLSHDLNLAALRCVEFDWLPKTKEQLQNLLAVFQKIGAIHDTKISDRIRVKAEITLNSQLAYWKQSYRSLLEPDLKMIGTINSLAGFTDSATQPTAPALVFVEVVQSVPLGGNHLYVKVSGTDYHLRFEAQPEKFVMGPSSHWLVALRSIEDNPIEVKIGRELKIVAHHAVIDHAEEVSH